MKIHSPYPEIINRAISENLKAEFVESENDADISLPMLQLPVNLSEILNYIESHDGKLTIGTLKLDVAKKTLSSADQKLELTEKEAAVLEYLARSGNEATREELVKSVWNYAEDANTNTVESHIYRMRQKISATFGREIIITTNGNYKIVEN